MSYEQVLTTGTREQTRDIINGSTFAYAHESTWPVYALTWFLLPFERFVPLSELPSSSFSTY
jgi:hypothetical protein